MTPIPQSTVPTPGVAQPEARNVANELVSLIKQEFYLPTSEGRDPLDPICIDSDDSSIQCMEPIVSKGMWERKYQCHCALCVINVSMFLVGVFEENALLLQWLVFFVSSTRSVHFFSLFRLFLFKLSEASDFQKENERRVRVSH